MRWPKKTPTRFVTRPAAGMALLWLLCAFGAGAAERVVKLRDIEFSPSRIRARAGDTLTFVNEDKFKHDVYIVRTADPNQVLFPATTIQAGASLRVPVPEKGLFTVYCTIHGGMRGRISTTGSFELTEEEKQLAAATKTLPPIVKKGEALFWGKAQCHQCHKMGERGEGLRGPDLRDIGFRAPVRARKLGLGSGTEYLSQSILEPGAYIVEGYTNDMAVVYQPPINLGAEEIKAVLTYLQSQGGEVDTWAIDLDLGKLSRRPALNPFRRGDPERGEEVFFKVASCSSCHTVSGRPASSAGPDLSAIGSYRNWTWLAQSILDPNAEIGVNWRYVTVYLKPESHKAFARKKKIYGFLRKDTSTEVQVLTAPNTLERFARDRVERIAPGEVSKMPTNYDEVLTLRQMADLIAYLESQKTRAQ